MNSAALLLVVLLLGVMKAELVTAGEVLKTQEKTRPETTVDWDPPATDLDLDLDSNLDMDLDLKAGHQEQAAEVSSELGREPRAADEAETKAKAEKVGADAAEDFLEVDEGQGRRKLPTSCTTAGVAACFADASNGDELELSAGTLSSTDGLWSYTQLALQNKYASIACSADGGVCVWQGATGKRVVYIYNNGGTSTLSHLIVKDGDTSGYGGGLFVNNSNVDLIIVAFIDNTASHGGAIFVTSGSSTATLQGCSFAGNTASNYGPDVYNNRQTVVIGGCPAGKPIRPSLLFPPLH